MSNNGYATFNYPAIYGETGRPFSMTSADFDADGDIDIAGVICGYDEVVVLWNDDISKVEPYIELIPLQFKLYLNYPNPFNALTTIRYDLSAPSDVTIDIYDLIGRKVETLCSGLKPAGRHQVTWNAEDCSSGIYFYKIQAGEQIETKKMLLLK
jgi:hypothetical protein